MIRDLDVYEVDELSQLKTDLQGLFEHPGWVFFEEFVRERYEGRFQQLRGACPTNVEEMSRFNREFGKLDELQMIPSYLRDYFKQIDEMLNYKRQAEEENDDS